MTVRIDEELLTQLKQAAQGEDRSLSAYVLRVLRQHVSEQAQPAKAKKAVMGSLRHLGAPGTLDDFQAARREMSESVAQGLARTIDLLDGK